MERDGEMYLSVKQSISEIIDANVWGEVKTLLTWDSDGNYEIVDQQVTPIHSAELTQSGA